MLVSRWQAPLIPAREQVLMMFETEGLKAKEEILGPGFQLEDRRHPFEEVRMVAQGQLLLNVAGNRLLLRAGDKIVIPANTRFSMKVEGDQACHCVFAQRLF